MARVKLTALSVERAHRSGESVLLSDGDELYLCCASKRATEPHGPCETPSPADVARLLDEIKGRAPTAERCLGRRLRGVEGT